MFKLTKFTTTKKISTLGKDLINSHLSKSCYANSRKVKCSQRNFSLGNNLRKRDKITFINQCKFIHLSKTCLDEYKFEVVPQLAESISEGDIRWEKKVGDSVNVDEQLGEIETDKTSIPIIASVSGVIEEILAEEGSTVKKDQKLVKIKIGAANISSQANKIGTSNIDSSNDTLKENISKTDSQTPSPKTTENISNKTSIPLTKPPIPPKPAGPIKTTDIADLAKQIAFNSESTGIYSNTDSRTENRIKMNRMRGRIAQRLKEAQNTYAMLTTFNEIDMTNAIDLKNQHKEEFLKKHKLKLGFMSTFVAACVHALKDQPVVNAVIDDQEIVYRDYIDISVAVASPKGLVVPVIRNAEKMNYAEIEKTINILGEKARSNLLAIEDMDGGTFTISNGGVFGSLMGTPIINPPQSAILGMHSIVERPVVINKQIVIRPMMYVALTYDHRLIDGREAVTFLKKIKSVVEDPRTMLLDL